MSDAMERYASGSNQAFAEVYDLLAPRLLRFLVRQTRNPAQAEDLAQQTFLQMHRARGTFIPGASVISWSFSIARRLLIDGSRKTSRDGLDPAANAAAIANLMDGTTPLLTLEMRHLAAAMAQAVAALPASQRDAFTLVMLEGLTNAEAAEVLGISVNAVKIRVHYAMDALRAARNRMSS